MIFNICSPCNLDAGPSQRPGCVNGRPLRRKCAKEQPFSDGACVGCGFSFGRHATRGRNTGHWQGGQGVRNTATLSSKERRKNQGVSRAGTKKTVSKKSQRVGLAGKKARQKKAAAGGGGGGGGK